MNRPSSNHLQTSIERFSSALEKFEQSPSFTKRKHVGRVLDTAERVLRCEGGPAAMYHFADRFDRAGIFAETDWDHPDRLQASLVPITLSCGQAWTITLECLSQLRLLAIAEGKTTRLGLSAEQAGNYLRKVLALSLDHIFERQTEAARQEGSRSETGGRVLLYVAETIGYEDLLEQLVEEIWRLLYQRPINVAPIRTMVTKLAAYCYDDRHETKAIPVGADRLISALYSPTTASREDPGIDVYAERLEQMDEITLQNEANSAARAMHDTGLVSPYHGVLIRHLLNQAPNLIAAALGLSATGVDSYLTYRQLVHALIDKAVNAETCQCLYGLACLLERAVLHYPGVASSLWRQINLPLTEAVQQRIGNACGLTHAADVHLLGGVISVLGQPLGIGQGDNATCQAARALSLWAYSDPDYLLQLLAWAGRDDGVLMEFHGHQLSSAFLKEGAAGTIGIDLDPVSVVLVPHLDRVYAEMTRLATRAGEDPHIYVNPEFHGWRVGRGFSIAVDVDTGKLKGYEDFIRRFFACYHPSYNGNVPIIHPQPVGVAVTDSMARFVGWHAVTLLRVAIDKSGQPRVYFYNPNNDSGQNWGNGVTVSTHGRGEFYGESSLPVNEFASRLYLFHYDPLEVWDESAIPNDVVEAVTKLGRESWAKTRISVAVPTSD